MKSVLVVEDQIEMLESIQTILEMEGYRVLTASHGRAGLQMAREHNPDLILSDVMMPEMNGYDLLRELRATSGLESTPFIFMTALAESTDMRRGMNLGADDYLTKPVSRESLLETIVARFARQLAQQPPRDRQKAFRPDFSSPQPLVDRLKLTPREAEVLLLVSQGKSNGDIAVILGMAEKTVKKHLTHVFEKLGVEGRNPATLAALEVLSGD